MCRTYTVNPLSRWAMATFGSAAIGVSDPGTSASVPPAGVVLPVGSDVLPASVVAVGTPSSGDPPVAVTELFAVVHPTINKPLQSATARPRGPIAATYRRAQAVRVGRSADSDASDRFDMAFCDRDGLVGL